MSDSHVSRVSAEAGGSKATGGASEPSLTETDTADSSEDTLGGSSVSGLSGLSEIMQAEPRPAAGGDALGAVPEAKLVGPGGSTKPVATPPQPGGAGASGVSGGSKWGLWVIALLALVVAAAGVGLMTLGGGDPDPNADPDTALDGSGVTSDNPPTP
ncbi:MAG: hypothetical protein AAFX76_08625 [Planctomycetota bacterium]